MAFKCATPLHNKSIMTYDIMATCLGWAELEGCGECIIPLSDSYHISRLDPECVLLICRELLLTMEQEVDVDETVLVTKSYGTCSGNIFIYKTHNKLTTTQARTEYSSLIYIYTVGFWASCLTGCIQRKDVTTIAKSIIAINRIHDTDELWYEIDKVYKMLGVPMINENRHIHLVV